MNENINLVEILKEHIGETFYSPLCGECKLNKINEDTYPIEMLYNNRDNLCFTKDGKFFTDKESECLLFPSKDQRDWNVWFNEQKKTFKTWSKFIKKNLHKTYSIVRHEGIVDCLLLEGETSIEKSAVALLKIYQLIEHYYGGNITNEEWENTDIPKYTINSDCEIIKYWSSTSRRHIAFHTEEQAKEFMSYPENVELLKDYFMI